MHISILTLFPEMFSGPFDSSIIKRARDKNLLTLDYIQIRDFAIDAYGTVDDHPYGGGHGMILRVDVLSRALDALKQKFPEQKTQTVLLDPRGVTFTQIIAESLIAYDHIILICGHYEGVDERITTLVDASYSIGDYILTGGEIPSMVIVDTVTRLLPGTLTKKSVTISESFSSQTTDVLEKGMLEYPHYTKPREFNGHTVPDVLLSGDHKKIIKWRRDQSSKRTKKSRPDLFNKT